MKISSRLIKISGVGIAVLAFNIALRATPIEYIFSGESTTGGSVGSDAFGPTSFQVTFVSDTTDFTPGSTTDDYDFSSASIAIQGVGTFGLINSSPNEYYVYENQTATHPTVGFGYTGTNDILDIANIPGLTTYNLTTAYALQTGSVFYTSAVPETTGGEITLGTIGTIVDPSFEAITNIPANAPDGGNTIYLAGIALAAIGLIRLRSGSRLAAIRC